MTVGLEGSSTPATALRCPKCAMPFEPGVSQGVTSLQCQACRSVLTVALLPAFVSPPEAISTSSGTLASEGEAACFFHPEKRADQTCERCGRFICTLCDMPFGGRHLCPKCLDSSKMAELIPVRFVGGYAAMLCGIIPIIFFPCGCIYAVPLTGPFSIALAMMTWKKPGSLVHGPRHGMAVVGMIGGLLQLLGTIGGIVGIVYAVKHG